MEKLKNSDTKKKVIISVICVVLAVAIGVGVYFFVSSKNKPTSTAPVDETVSETITSEETTVPAEYNDYYTENNDFVGWIKIDGTHVDYPVVQTDNNDYYLNHNFKKKKEGRGAIFMDKDCNAQTLDTNTVIHGHNWLDKTMFSQLTKYSDFDFYKEHTVIEFNTRTEMHKWKIVSVFITSASKSEDNGYVFNYVYPHMESINFEGYVNELKTRSMYNTGVDIKEGDKFLTLSTCTRELDTKNHRADVRIVIVGRMVRDGESATVDTSSATINKNAKYPQIWYDVKGKENPYKNDERWVPKKIK